MSKKKTATPKAKESDWFVEPHALITEKEFDELQDVEFGIGALCDMFKNQDMEVHSFGAYSLMKPFRDKIDTLTTVLRDRLDTAKKAAGAR
jgi:hypothetical protein